MIVAGGDLTDPQAILGNAPIRTHLDFTRPVAILLVAVPGSSAATLQTRGAQMKPAVRPRSARQADSAAMAPPSRPVGTTIAMRIFT